MANPSESRKATSFGNGVANVTNDMGITHEEIFGPMLSSVTRDIEEELIVTANATVYAIS